MDAAEKWLMAADPDYAEMSEGWKHIRETGEYQPPLEELPVGDTNDVYSVLLEGTGKYVGNTTESMERACAGCGRMYEPREAAHRYCGDTCRATARRAYKAAHERARRVVAA